MKKISYFIVLMAFMASFTSCEKIAELTDVDFEATVEIPEISVTPVASTAKTDGTYIIDVTEVVDLNSDEQIKKYWSKIKDLEVSEFVLEFYDLPNPPSNVNLVVTIESNSSLIIPFSASISNGTILKFDAQQLIQLASMFMDDDTFTIKVNGTVDNNQSFKIKGSADLKVTANPLN